MKVHLPMYSTLAMVLYLLGSIVSTVALLSDEDWIDKIGIGIWDWRYTDPMIMVVRIASITALGSMVLGLVLHFFGMSWYRRSRGVHFAAITFMFIAFLGVFICWFITLIKYEETTRINDKVSFQYRFVLAIFGDLIILASAICAVVSAVREKTPPRHY